MKTTVQITIDTDELKHYTDAELAKLWHITQANPAEYGDREAGELAEEVGREIICRFLKSAGFDLWVHQGRDHFWKALTQHARCVDGEWVAKEDEGGK